MILCLNKNRLKHLRCAWKARLHVPIGVTNVQKKTEIQAWTQINLTPPFPNPFGIASAFRPQSGMKRRSLLWTTRNQSLLENLLSAQLPGTLRRQLRGGTDSVRVTPEGDLKHIDIKPMFRINMAGLAFPPDHPYFKEAPEWVIKEGGAAYSEWTYHEVKNRLGGKKFNTPAGEIKIAKTGIKKLIHVHHPLVWVLDAVIKNSELISEKLLNVPDGKGRDFTYDYLKIKGINEFLVIRRYIKIKLKIAYDIMSKIKTD